MGTALPGFVSLEGKVAIVTGAASGIGRETSLLLAEMGARVALLDIDDVSGEQILKEIGQERAAYYHCDVRVEQQCISAARLATNHFGRIDILFNNAGVVIRKDVMNLDVKDWDHVLDTCLKGTFLMSKAVLPLMIKQGGGVIINTGSGWSLKAGPDAAAYCAAKAGVLNLTRSMAIDYGKYNIRVNCVCPGDIDTPMLESERVQLGLDEAAFYTEAADRPLNRIGKPSDVAMAVLFLSSNMSAWITGTSLVVDGGGLA